MLHSTCPEERLYGKETFESNIIIHFLEVLPEFVSTGLSNVPHLCPEETM